MRWREWGRWSWRLEFKAADLWVGAYIRRHKGKLAVGYHIWVCVVPMLPLHVCLVRWKGDANG